jgi:hypothetical protein
MKPVAPVTIRTLKHIAKIPVNLATTIILSTVTVLNARNMKNTVDAGAMRMIIARGTTKAMARNRMGTAEGARQAKTTALALTVMIKDSDRVKAMPLHMNRLIATDRASVMVIKMKSIGAAKAEARSGTVIEMKNMATGVMAKNMGIEHATVAKMKNTEKRSVMVAKMKNMETGIVTAVKAKIMETVSVMGGVKIMKTGNMVIGMKDWTTIQVTGEAKIMVDLREDMKSPVMVPGQTTTATVVMKPLVPNVSTSMGVTMMTEKKGMDTAITTVSIQMTE